MFLFLLLLLIIIFFTSNCQCAACKSCFAWSAAQPAVRTNWLIMTWCLSSSIFDEAPCPTRGDWLWDRLSTVFPSLASLLLYSAPLPHSSTITAGWANTNIYCRSGSRRSAAWLTGGSGQSGESVAGGICMLRAEGLGSACFFTDWCVSVCTLKHTLDENAPSQCVRFKLQHTRGVGGAAEEVNSHSSGPTTGLFWTTTTVSTRFVCKAPEGRLLWMTAALVQFPGALCHYLAKYGKQIHHRQLHRSELN